MMGDAYGWWGMLGFWGSVHMLLFWLGVIVLTVLLARWLLPTAPRK